MSETTRNLELEQRLSAFVDGELDPEEAEEIRRILGGDPAARARLDDLQALSVALQTTLEEIGEEADFEGFADEVMRRVERAKAPAAAPGRRRFFEWGVRRRAPIFAAAAALAAVATVVAVGPGILGDSNRERLLLEGDPADTRILAMTTQGDHGATLFKTSAGTTIIYLTGK